MSDNILGTNGGLSQYLCQPHNHPLRDNDRGIDMEPNLINGLFLLAASLITGLIAIYASKSGAQVEKLKSQNESLRNNKSQLLRQIESYHLLEDLYANDIAINDPKSPKAIKTEYRNKVVDQHQCDRPEMTSNEAKKRLQKIT